MNIPKYRLFRKMIDESDRLYSDAYIREEHTHIISIEVDYKGDRYASGPKGIEPKVLKFMVRAMKGAIIPLINMEAGKEVVTSIG